MGVIGVAAAAIVAMLGGAIGSFLNVVIYRMPVGRSIVKPRSSCPSCSTAIHPLHNIPVFGWLIVRGKCAACGVKLSLRYPLVEAALVLLALALFHDFAGGPLTVDTAASENFLLDVVAPFSLYFLFVAALIAVTFIDLDWFIIPDSITLPGIPLGVLAAFGAGHAIGVTWQDALIGAVAGAGVLIVVILAYSALTGREGMGGGDWKLLGFIGAWLGWEALPVVLLLGSLQGIVAAVALRRAFAVEELPPDPTEGGAAPVAEEGAADEDEAPEAGVEAEDAAAGEPRADPKSFGQLAIPFGPFLALGAVEFLLFRDEIRELITAYVAP